MNIIFKKNVSVFHIVASLYISSGILVFLGEPVLSVSPNIENIPCQISAVPGGKLLTRFLNWELIDDRRPFL